MQKKFGSGWVGPGLIRIKKIGKSSKTKFCVCTIRPKDPLWCTNIKSTIVVGRHAVSRYHQLKKFFIAGDDPDYCDHYFPTPGYLICLSDYMVIQHPQSGNTQDASGRDHVKFGHTGPLGLERNRQYGRVCLLTLRYGHIQMMDSILICRLIIDKSTSIFFMYMTQCTSVLFRLHDVMCMQAAFYPVFCDFVIELRFG